MNWERFSATRSLGCVVGFEIKHIIINKRKHQAIAHNARATEHGAHGDGAEARHLFDKEFLELSVDAQAVASACFNWTLSPQPQAEVWFGLLKVKPDFRAEVW